MARSFVGTVNCEDYMIKKVHRKKEKKTEEEQDPDR